MAIYAVPASAGLVGTTTNPTGVTDLVVDGNTYDVTFSTDFFLNVFPTGPQFNDWIPATDAATALAAALNSYGVTALGGHSCATLANIDHQGGCGLLFPFPTVPGWEISTATAGWFYWQGDPSFTPPIPPHSDTEFGQSWTYFSNANPALGLTGNEYLEWAHFTLTATGAPEPASLLLFAIGLSVLSQTAWRRRK